MSTSFLSLSSAVLGVALCSFAAPALAQTDVTAPVVVRAFAPDSNHIHCTFNEAITASSAGTKWNFSGVGSVASSTLLPGDTTVRITLNGSLPDGSPTTLSVASISDVNGNTMGLPQSVAFVHNDAMPNVSITEIYYRSPGSSATGDSLEYIEITNGGPKVAKLGGLRLRGSINFVFPAHMQLLPGEHRLISRAPSKFYAVFGKNSMKWNDGFLPNNAGKVVIVNTVNLRIDSVAYSGSSPWIDSITASTHVMTFCDMTLDNANPASWVAASTFSAIHPTTGDSLFSTPLLGCPSVVVDTTGTDTTGGTGTVATYDVQSLQLGMFPNPAQQATMLALPFAGQSNIVVIDRMGRTVHTALATGAINLPVSHLANGLYIVRATEQGGTRTAQASLVVANN